MQKEPHRIVYKLELYLLFLLAIVDISYVLSFLVVGDVINASTFEFEFTSFPLIVALLFITSLFFVHYVFGLLANFSLLLVFFILAITGYYYDDQKRRLWLHIGLFIASVIYAFIIADGMKNVAAAISV